MIFLSMATSVWGRAFQARKAERGYAKITWTQELGGMGGTPMQAVIYEQEEEQYELPTGVLWYQRGDADTGNAPVCAPRRSSNVI